MVGADNLFIRAILLILGFEYIADQQQWGLFLHPFYEMSTLTDVFRFSSSQDVVQGDWQGAHGFYT